MISLMKRIHLLSVTLSVLVVAEAAFAQASGPAIPIVVSPSASSAERLAAQDLVNSLQRLYPADPFILATQLPKNGRAVLVGDVNSDPALRELLPTTPPSVPESFVVTSTTNASHQVGLIVGADPRGTVYGLYALLRKLGCGFYLSYDAFPAPRTNAFSFEGWALSDRSLTRDRIVFNWHNFLSGCSTWNLPEWRAWIRQSQKMGYNAVMVHAYGNNPMAGFEFDGQQKSVGYLSTTVKGRDWSTMHVNDVRRLWGGDVFTQAIFGADAARVPDEQRVAAAQKLMRQVFASAEERDVGVFFAVDVDTPSANPQELVRLLPASGRFAASPSQNPLWLANPDTPEGYAFYRAEVEGLMKAYPQITKLVVWFRRGGTPWMKLKMTDLPAAWQREFSAEIARTPEAAQSWCAPGLFAIGKIVRAFQRALTERGAQKTAVAAGTWGFEFLDAADRFFPPGVPLIGLDYDVIHERSQLRDAAARAPLRKVGAHRPLIPVVWAQHDDGRYVGRPFTPLAGFASKLEDAQASGFGIIHWTTRPLGLYFASLGAQVWQSTRDQPLQTTCEDMAERSFGSSTRAAMGEYLFRWITGAPQFARETSDWFIDRPLTNIAQVVAGCRERLKLINGVDQTKLTPDQRDRVNYFKGLEQFIIGFHETHDVYQQSQSALKKGDLALARKLMAGCHPGRVIEQFARFSSLGGMTRGEQGLVVTMNTRWDTRLDRYRQTLGLEAVRINFAPTSHDPLAQSPGRDTFLFEPNHTVWECRGERETGHAVFVLATNRDISAVPGFPETWKEICRSGITSETPIKFAFPQVAAGDYRLHLLLLDPEATAPDQHVFDLSIGQQSSNATWAFSPVTNEFLRIVCNGNSENAWNSLVEVRLNGVLRENGQPLVTSSSAAPGFPAQAAMDNDPRTRWAEEGRGQWLQFRLQPGTVNREIELHWYRGDSRQPFFQLQTSSDGRTWTPVRNLHRSLGFAQNTERVDIFQLAGRRDCGIELSREINLTQRQQVEVRLHPVQGRAAICGAVLEPVGGGTGSDHGRSPE